MSNFSIPYDIWIHHIIPALELEDIAKLCRCCKEWNKVFSHLLDFTWETKHHFLALNEKWVEKMFCFPGLSCPVLVYQKQFLVNEKLLEQEMYHYLYGKGHIIFEAGVPTTERGKENAFIQNWKKIPFMSKIAVQRLGSKMMFQFTIAFSYFFEILYQNKFQLSLSSQQKIKYLTLNKFAI